MPSQGELCLWAPTCHSKEVSLQFLMFKVAPVSSSILHKFPLVQLSNEETACGKLNSELAALHFP